jgi:hypothetical protein
MNFIQITNNKSPKVNKKANAKRLINEANINALKTALHNTDWQPLYSDNNVDSSFNTFWDIFNAHFTEHCPIMRVRFNKNKHGSWFIIYSLGYFPPWPHKYTICTTLSIRATGFDLWDGQH